MEWKDGISALRWSITDATKSLRPKQGERFTDTVQFPPHDVPMPGSSADHIVIEVAAELTDAISNFKHASPLKDVQDTHIAALNKLSDIFNGATR